MGHEGAHVKRTETVVVEICDLCQTNHAWSSRSCQSCGKAMCYDCGEKYLIDYQGELFIRSSKDFRYCTDCNAKLTAAPTPLFAALRELKALNAEVKAWNEDFCKRRKAAQDRIEELRT